MWALPWEWKGRGCHATGLLLPALSGTGTAAKACASQPGANAFPVCTHTHTLLSPCPIFHGSLAKLPVIIPTLWSSHSSRHPPPTSNHPAPSPSPRTATASSLKPSIPTPGRAASPCTRPPPPTLNAWTDHHTIQQSNSLGSPTELRRCHSPGCDTTPRTSSRGTPVVTCPDRYIPDQTVGFKLEV